MDKQQLNIFLELENLPSHPVEVSSGLLFMGDQEHGEGFRVLRDLHLSGFRVSQELDSGTSEKNVNAADCRLFLVFRSRKGIQKVPVSDSLDSDHVTFFENISSFIGELESNISQQV